MDRNREARRVGAASVCARREPMSAVGNGLSRRRHRVGSFRDSPEEEGPVELPEAARLRDRGGSTKKDRDRERGRDRERERERDRERDRLSSRSKRRRRERVIMVHGNIDDGGDDSSEESVNDDEEYDDGGVGPPSSLKMLPPTSNNISAASFSSSLSNHHHHHHSHNNNHQKKNFPPTKVFRSSPSPASVSPLVSIWKAADEMIGVSVPRKARSVCTKRPHESWASSTTGGGVFASCEQNNRPVSSTSPANRVCPASIVASPSLPAPTSPSSSSVSVRKKLPTGTKQKPLPPKSSSSCKLSSPVAVQDEIEIEIAEVLSCMRMPLATSKQESAGNDLTETDAKSTVEVKYRVPSTISNPQTLPQASITLAVNSSSSYVTAIAPKRKKPRHVKYEDENSSRVTTIKSEAEAPSKSQVPLGDQLKSSGSGEGVSSVVDSTNPQPKEIHASLDSSTDEKENNLSKEETILPKVESSSGFRSDGDGATTLGVKLSSPEKEKFEIDLMAPPPVRSSSERGGEMMECVAAEAKPKVTEVLTEVKPLLKEDRGDGTIHDFEEKKRPRTVAEAEHHMLERNCELKLDIDKSDHVGSVNKHHAQKQPPQQLSFPDKIAQGSHLPLQMSMPGWPGGLPKMGYMAPTQGVVPTNTSSLSAAAMQPPPHLLFNQPKPKRCATHCYIARNIQSHQQFTKMNHFWPAAAGSAPLYGTNACNLSLMPPTESQGSVLGRSSNPVQDKNPQSTSKSSVDTAQRNQILLQQALPPGAANSILHGPTFIFPLGQQPHAAATIAAASVRPPNSGITSSGATPTSTSMNGSASATPAGAPTMSFSYPAMPGNETQYLAILQNNGYPFPVPAHVGASPAYRGAPGQPMPFFNGSYYSSQMIQPPHHQPQKQQQQQQSGQMFQSHASSNQNGSVSTNSSTAQKHLQNQQLRPPINHGNSQGFPTHKVQSQPLSFQQRQQPKENATQHSETVGEDSPSTADSRGPRSNVACGQNYGMAMQPTNLGLMSSAPLGGVVGSSSSHGEKKAQQQVSKTGAESFQSQGYAMTFAFNGANTAPALNMSSIAQNHAMFHSMPEAARQGYQMMAVAQAAQQKMNYSASPQDGKSGSIGPAANNTEEQRKTRGTTGKTSGGNGGQSIAFSSKHDLADTSVSAVTSGSIVDSSSRLLNLGSALPQSLGSMPTSHHHHQQHLQQQQQQHMQRSHSQQPYPTMYLQKQQRYATSVAASAARTKGPVASNGSGFPDHNITTSPAGTTKLANANSGFPQNLVQSSSNQVQSSQWKNNSPRTTTTAQAQSPSILSPSSSVAAASSLRNVSHKQQSRPQQSQISFAANSKSMGSGSPVQQAQGGTNHQAQFPPMKVGSPSTSSVSKNGSGSPRTTASASVSSAANKAGHASSTSYSSSQPTKNLQSASVVSSTGGRNNDPSVLGNPTTSSGSKSQQQQQLPKHGLQQQAQLFFSNPYMQAQHQHQQQQITISPSGGYYIQRHQQQSGSAPPAAATYPPVTGAATTTSDPAKAIAVAAAAAAAANNMKGGGGMGKTQQHQLVPPGFPYVHGVPSAVQVKPVDQKQQAGE